VICMDKEEKFIDCEYEVKRILRDFEYSHEVYESEFDRVSHLLINLEITAQEHTALMEEIIHNEQIEREKIALKLISVVTRCLTHG